MTKDRIRMPSSSAGLTTFYEDSKSLILISPKTVMILSLLVVVLTILLNNIN